VFANALVTIIVYIYFSLAMLVIATYLRVDSMARIRLNVMMMVSAATHRRMNGEGKER
jgi:hypothetical protein